MASLSKSLALDLCGSTHVGKVRSHNEDNFLLLPDLNTLQPAEDELAKVASSDAGTFILVADGMGGGAAGEVASEMAKVHCLQRLSSLEQWPEDDEDRLSILCEMIIGAHRDIAERSFQNVDMLGMGTTATIVLILDGKAYIAWSGDSRVYRYNPGGVEQDRSYQLPDMQILIDEHSVVWDMVRRGKISPEGARVHPESHIITQNLGFADEAPFPDSKVVNLYQGDRLLVCSDGLNSMLSDPEIRGLLSGQGETAQTVRDLTQASNEAGGHDNITIVLADVRQGPALELADLNKTSGERMITQQLGGTPLLAATDTAGLSPKSGGTTKKATKTPVSKLLLWGVLTGFLLIGGYFIYEAVFNKRDGIETTPSEQDEENRTPQDSNKPEDITLGQGDKGLSSSDTNTREEKVPDSESTRQKRMAKATKIEWVTPPPKAVQVGESFKLTVEVKGENFRRRSIWVVRKAGEKKEREAERKWEEFSFLEPGVVGISYRHNRKSISCNIIVKGSPEVKNSDDQAVEPADSDNKSERLRELLDDISQIKQKAESKLSSYEEVIAQKAKARKFLPLTSPMITNKQKIEDVLKSLDEMKSFLSISQDSTKWDSISADLVNLKGQINAILEPKN